DLQPLVLEQPVEHAPGKGAVRAAALERQIDALDTILFGTRPLRLCGHVEHVGHEWRTLEERPAQGRWVCSDEKSSDRRRSRLAPGAGLPPEPYATRRCPRPSPPCR